MTLNPLFPHDDKASAGSDPDGYLLPPNSQRKVEPLNGPANAEGADQAAALIRQKLEKLYKEEPDSRQELAEATIVRPRSKHQEFMYNLSTSGRSLADIQTEWHNYYQNLPDNEKHEVWQEFYANNNALQYAQPMGQPLSATVPDRTPSEHPAVVSSQQNASIPKPARISAVSSVLDNKTVQDIKEQIRGKISTKAMNEAKHSAKSLLFGLSIGILTIVIFMFGFFNELIITPFIQPGRTASATPVIVDPNSIKPTDTPEVIIPKINVEIPVDYNLASSDEATIQKALESGVIHYPTTVHPGENGNAAFFGHSSNNIFNKGKYKFAFVLLHELKTGDTFYLTYNGKVYIYRVFARRIVSPDTVSVLSDTVGKTATATLITCDPPGTSNNRLVVTGEQVSPAVSSNISGATPSVTSPNTITGNGPNLLQRLWDGLF